MNLAGYFKKNWVEYFDNGDSRGGHFEIDERARALLNYLFSPHANSFAEFNFTGVIDVRLLTPGTAPDSIWGSGFGRKKVLAVETSIYCIAGIENPNDQNDTRNYLFFVLLDKETEHSEYRVLARTPLIPAGDIKDGSIPFELFVSV